MNERQMASNIVAKIYEAGGEEALIRFFDSKGEDFPAIQLTSKEMSFLNGGGFISWVKQNRKEIMDIVILVGSGVQIGIGIGTANPLLFASGSMGVYDAVNRLFPGKV